MKGLSRPALAASLALPVVLLSGCLFTTRRLPLPKPPDIVQTVSPENLVDTLNKRWEAIESLNATVDIQASVLKSKEGVARDYTPIRGIILMRKPELLRVYGRVPVIGTEMFDMVSDGKNFTLYVPSKNKAIKGSNSLQKKSASQLENMRPGFFLDAMVVRGLDPDDLYTVTADTETVEDASKKHLLITPEYILSIMRRKGDSHQLTPVRVVTFHRDNMLPYNQDIYDSNGNLETAVAYSNYSNFDSGPYPATITIKRPLEDYQIVLSIEKLTRNMDLKDDQFQINNIPEGTPVQKLE